MTHGTHQLITSDLQTLLADRKGAPLSRDADFEPEREAASRAPSLLAARPTSDGSTQEELSPQFSLLNEGSTEDLGSLRQSTEAAWRREGHGLFQCGFIPPQVQ